MTSAQRIYPIRAQELLALIYALKKWKLYFFGMKIIAYTDNASLATCKINRLLSGRKACWIQLRCEFSVKILYREAQLKMVAYALSRRKDYRPIQSLYLLENKEMTYSCIFLRCPWKRSFRIDVNNALVQCWPSLQSSLLFSSRRATIVHTKEFRTYLVHNAWTTWPSVCCLS